MSNLFVQQEHEPDIVRGAAPPLIGKANGAPAPVIRHGRERYLCSRCPQDFASREQLTAHMQKGHPPVSNGRPFGDAPTVDFPRGGEA